MKKIFRREVIIGLTAVVAILILVFGIDYLKGINIFHPANYYYVTYTNVEGLAQSAPVTVNGYKVGLVREIQYEYDNPGHILVELSLDKSLKVPKGSKAVLTSDLLGTATIALELAPGNDHHEVGDRLIGVNAKGLMDAVNETVMPSVGTILPRIDSLLVNVNSLVGDPALANAIRRLDYVMANVEASTVILQRALKPTPAIVGSAGVAMNDVKSIAANLKAISEDLTTVSHSLREMPLDSTLTNLNAMSDNLLALSKQLNDPNSSLGLLMHDPQLYNNVNNAAAHIDSILIDIKREPKRYIPKIKVF